MRNYKNSSENTKVHYNFLFLNKKRKKKKQQYESSPRAGVIKLANNNLRPFSIKGSNFFYLIFLRKNAIYIVRYIIEL